MTCLYLLVTISLGWAHQEITLARRVVLTLTYLTILTILEEEKTEQIPDNPDSLL